jgi:DNA-binding MarR family transcriptional regulator
MDVISSVTLAEEAISLVRLLFLAGRDKSLGLRGNKLYFHVLYVLCDHPPPGLTMSQLAEAMLVSPQQLSRLINGMEENGLVQREHDPSNRRRVYVRALSAGLAELDKIIAETRNWIAAELSSFSAEETRRLHECFSFIGRLLEKGIMRQNTQKPPIEEENSDEEVY